MDLIRKIIAPICIVAAASFVSRAHSAQYLAGPFEKSHAYSSAVITQSGKIAWLAGTAGFKDENGKDISSDFKAQARFIFGKLDKTLKQAGGNLQDMVEMTVYITERRQRGVVRRHTQRVLSERELSSEHVSHNQPPRVPGDAD